MIGLRKEAAVGIAMLMLSILGCGGGGDESEASNAVSELCARLLCDNSLNPVGQIQNQCQSGKIEQCTNGGCEECDYNGCYHIDCRTLQGTVTPFPISTLVLGTEQEEEGENESEFEWMDDLEGEDDEELANDE